MLLVGAGASFSTKDVETGYVHALKAAGTDVKLYLLDRRIGMAQKWLNRLWRERGAVYADRPTWPDVIYRAGVESLEMALRFEVDWVIAISAMYLHPDALILMRRAGLRTAVLFTESPYDDHKQAPVAELVDACWTTERSSVQFLRQFNRNTFYLRHAYDPERHRPIYGVVEPVDAPAHDVVFVGSGFQERIDMLAGVDWSGIDLGLYGQWELLPPRHRLRQHLKGKIVDNATATALYRQAKIGLNLYRTSRDYSRTPEHAPHAESMNPRAYELAACGVFQLSDRRSEGMETFDWTVPTFTDSVHLNEQVRYYLKRPALRLDKARQARQRIEPHTFAARAAQLLADLDSLEQQPIAKGA